ncbi:MAG TPA: Holliday junction resolvase RuvX [Candidatus Marinimicrobia bacterium]|nr:Holliday junction resolvase RuvX [Candidatus Neomarinimicrobiota bacterium]
MNRRILAVDYGQRRVGLAMSDPLRIIATALPTLQIKKMADAVIHLKELCVKHDVEIILIGYPQGLSGNKTRQTLIVEEFAEAVKNEIDCMVKFWDERYSSADAIQILVSQGIKTGHNKEKIDAMAARLILQDFLDSQK